jgi:hypothetical protein
MRFIVLILGILFFAQAQADVCGEDASAKISSTNKSFSSTTTLQDCYVPGTSETVNFYIEPDTANLEAPRTVVVFDIVQDDGNGGVRSVVPQVLDLNSIAVEPDIFREPLSVDQVRAGVEANVSFRINDSASSGEYVMVISFFRLNDGQRPNQVTSDPNSLAGRVFYRFSVE